MIGLGSDKNVLNTELCQILLQTSSEVAKSCCCPITMGFFQKLPWKYIMNRSFYTSKTFLQRSKVKIRIGRTELEQTICQMCAKFRVSLTNYHYIDILREYSLFGLVSFQCLSYLMVFLTYMNIE